MCLRFYDVSRDLRDVFFAGRNRQVHNKKYSKGTTRSIASRWWFSSTKVSRNCLAYRYVQVTTKLKNASDADFVRCMGISSISRSTFLMSQGQWNRSVCIASATMIVVRKEFGRSVECIKRRVSFVGFVLMKVTFRDHTSIHPCLRMIARHSMPIVNCWRRYCCRCPETELYSTSCQLIKLFFGGNSALKP